MQKLFGDNMVSSLEREQIRSQILEVMNSVRDIPIQSYEEDDRLFDLKYRFVACDMAYILLGLSEKFNFELTEGFIDALEHCTFKKLEELVYAAQS